MIYFFGHHCIFMIGSVSTISASCFSRFRTSHMATKLSTKEAAKFWPDLSLESAVNPKAYLVFSVNDALLFTVCMHKLKKRSEIK